MIDPAKERLRRAGRRGPLQTVSSYPLHTHVKIIHITAGTGGSYCGTCLRDATLVRALRALGHGAEMVPVYLPIRDESEWIGGDIVLGGVKAFLQAKSPVFRKTPRFVDRLLDSPRLLRRMARLAGATRPEQLGELTCSALQGAGGPHAKEFDRLIARFAEPGQRPDVVIVSNVLLIAFAAEVKRRLGVRVICSLQGEDVFLDRLLSPWREDAFRLLRGHVEYVDHIVAVSHAYARTMQTPLEIPDGKLRVIHNGIDLGGYERFARRTERPTIGFLSRVISAKGPHILVDAFEELKRRNRVPEAQLLIAGTRVPGAEPFVEELRRRIEDSDFRSDMTLLDELTRDDKIAFYHQLSLLSVPVTYDESFGLYTIEAMAAGTPVVQPRRGAFPEIIEATGGGVLYDPEERTALPDALEALLLDGARREALGVAGKAAVHERFTAQAMGEQFLALIGQLS